MVKFKGLVHFISSADFESQGVGSFSTGARAWLHRPLWGWRPGLCKYFMHQAPRPRLGSRSFCSSLSDSLKRQEVV